MSGRWGGGGAGLEAGASVPPPAARPVCWRVAGLLTAHLARAPSLSPAGPGGAGAPSYINHLHYSTCSLLFFTLCFSLFAARVAVTRTGINLLNKYDPARRSQFCGNLNKTHPLVLCRAVIKV